MEIKLCSRSVERLPNSVLISLKCVCIFTRTSRKKDVLRNGTVILIFLIFYIFYSEDFLQQANTIILTKENTPQNKHFRN